MKNDSGDLRLRRLRIDPFGGLYVWWARDHDEKINLLASGKVLCRDRIGVNAWILEYNWQMRGEYAREFATIAAASMSQVAGR